MLIGALAMAISMFALGLSFYMDKMGILSLIFMLSYTAAFAMSWGPVTWVLLSEIFPNSIKGAMSIAVASMWIANLIISWTFPMMNESTLLTRTIQSWIFLLDLRIDGNSGCLVCLEAGARNQRPYPGGDRNYLEKV